MIAEGFLPAAAFARSLSSVREETHLNPTFPHRPGPATVSLERALSKLGVLSRSEARQAIATGRVRISGRVVRDPLTAVVPENAAIELDGAPVAASAPVVIALHKPRGVVTTASDPEGRPTVVDLVADLGVRVVPVGRLDLATSGLLLLTSDTRLADWLTDPTNGVPRTYLVTAKGEVSDAEARRMEDGIENGGETLVARSVVVRKRSRRETHLVVTLTEGKNRELRRMLGAVGHEITRLRRVAFGGVELGDLPPGKWRKIEDEELERAFPGARRKKPPKARSEAPEPE